MVALLVRLTVVSEPFPLPILLLPFTDSVEPSIVSVAFELFPAAILKSCTTFILLLSYMVTDISELSPIPTLTLPFTSIPDALFIVRYNLPAADTPPRILPLTVTLLLLVISIVEAFVFGAPSTPVETIKSWLTFNADESCTLITPFPVLPKIKSPVPTVAPVILFPLVTISLFHEILSVLNGLSF